MPINRLTAATNTLFVYASDASTAVDLGLGWAFPVLGPPPLRFHFREKQTVEKGICCIVYTPTPRVAFAAKAAIMASLRL